METGVKKLPLISATDTSLLSLLKQRTQWLWCTHVSPFTRCFSCCSHETLNQDFRWETQSRALHYPFMRCFKKNLEGPFVDVFPLIKTLSVMSLKSIPFVLKIIEKTFWKVVLHPSPSGHSYCSSEISDMWMSHFKFHKRKCWFKLYHYCHLDNILNQV